MPNISDTLKKSAEILRQNEIVDSYREASSLLAFVLQKDKFFLIAHSEYELSGEEERRFQDAINRRARREPFQHIVGKQEFFGLDFAVTKSVLIPRPETEMLVEAAIEILEDDARFCEVGIGSGCIAVSILYELKAASAIGLDISEAALKIARANAETHRVAERLELKISDVFENLRNEKFDLIVSNPPYIPSVEIKNLQTEVGKFEPLAALTDGKNGLSIIETMIKNAPRFLKSGGFLLLEIGINQSTAVEKMFDEKIWSKIEIVPDFQNIPRMVKAQISEN